MERVLRSLIQLGNSPDSDDCYQNWTRLNEYVIEFNEQEDKKIVDYLKSYYNQMASPPDYTLVKEYFEKKDEIEVVTRLEDIKRAPHYIKTNFISIVRSIVETQQIKNFALACKDAQNIAEHGRNLQKPKDGKVLLRGVNDAVNFIYDKLPEFTRIEGGTKLEGVISDDADEILSEYDKIAANPNAFGDRNLFGFEPVDSVCKGHRRGEYWIHAAAPGELKSSVAVNYAYNNSFLYGRNIFYAILEMPYEQLRRQFYALHSSHGKFVTEWHKEDGYIGLDYGQIRDGELSPRNYERLRIVAQDFKTNSKGKLYIWRPDHEVTIEDIKRKSEMFHNKYGCDGIIIDHLGLVKPKRYSSNFVDSSNSIVREARLMALNFARGKSVPVLVLFQINRQGKARADKNDGRYDFSSLATANEAEKSADVITYTYLNEQLRREGKFYLGNLKNRDNPHFDRMVGKIIWKTRRMRAIESSLIDLNSSDNLMQASEQIKLTASDMIL